MRRCIFATIFLIALAGAAQAATPSAPSASERRTALVIGNSEYKLISPLRNPVNDARAMARALRELGFDVIARENLTRYEMRKTIRDFGRELGQGGVGLFYYAGHGLQIDGVNYMVPLDAPIEFEDDVEVEAVPVRTVLVKMASAQNRLNIVILDSCRNNPYARSFRAATRGLAQMSAPTGTLVAYAAAPGGLAMDGDGPNGVYTGELLEAMQEPGLRIEDVFKRVRVAVRDTSEGQQIPWEASSLTGDFYFRLPTSEPSPDPAEAALWQAVKNSTNANDYLAYLEAYPSGVYVPLAKMRFDTLKAEAEVAALAPQQPPATWPPSVSLVPGAGSFDGDWIFEISEPTYMARGYRVETKVAGNKFSVNFMAHGWSGKVTGRIDKFGNLTGVFSAIKASWTDRFAKISTEYSNGLFEVEFEARGGTSRTRWKMTLTPTRSD